MKPCKICGADAPLHGVVDFNKSCEARNGLYLPVSGIAVWYQRCADCGFLFTAQFDGWTPADWKREVYNGSYGAVDPDYVTGDRARANADLIGGIHGIETSSVLDFGGGDGALAELLQQRDIDAESHDPLRDGALLWCEPKDLIVSFEVFEHTPTPIETAKDALAFLKRAGWLLFSTLTCDDLPRGATDWWYIAPRNGHISIHTTKSLDRMFGDLGYRVRHHSAGLHSVIRDR